jgi:hypothetical protein
MDEGELLVRYDTERLGVVDKANSKQVDVTSTTSYPWKFLSLDVPAGPRRTSIKSVWRGRNGAG